MKKFLTFDLIDEAKAADILVAQHLRDTQQTVCNSWSGVFERSKLFSTSYGILWGNEVAQALGEQPESSIVEEVVNDKGESDWQPIVEEVSE